MKKLFSILLALALVFSMAACSSSEEPAEESAIEPETETEETAEGADSQNSIMNFVGNYASDRCTITVEAGEGNIANFTISWASSAAEVSEWTMSGEFDGENNTVYYNDCVKRDLVFAEDGSISSEETSYEGGHGTFAFDYENNTLTWTDDIEHVADGATFTFF